HLVPVVKVGVLGGAEAERETGVVDQHVDGAELFWQARDRRGHACPVPDVEPQREDQRAELAGEIVKPVRAAGGGDDPGSVGGEPAGHGGAEATARAGDENDSWLGACHPSHRSHGTFCGDMAPLSTSRMSWATAGWAPSTVVAKAGETRPSRFLG